MRQSEPRDRSRRGVLLCFCGGWLLGACQARPQWFSAAEKTYLEFELQRRDDDIRSGDLADSIAGPMRTRIGHIKDVLTPGRRARLEKLQLGVLSAESSYFFFESGFDASTGERLPTIRTSAETTASLLKISMAQQVGAYRDADGAWLHRYMLYVRRVPDGLPILDPLRASGMVTPENKLAASVPPAKFDEMANEAKKNFDCMLTFLLAHEVAHLLEPRPDRGSKESLADYLARVRADEAKADSVALDILADVERRQPGEKTLPLYLVGAPFLFLQWVVTMQASRHALKPTTHPLDHVRAASVMKKLLVLLPTLPITPTEVKLVTKAANEGLEEMSRIEKVGLENYFADLDQQAAKVTVESLRFIP